MLSNSPIYYFYCPSNLDLPAKLKAGGYEELWQKQIWRLYYIITAIYRKRWSSEYDKALFVELNSVILQRVLHSKWAKPALDVLLQLGIIETDNHYIKAVAGVQGKSRGYRIAEPYNSAKFRHVKEVDCSKISKRLIRAQNKHLAVLTPQEQYLMGWLKKLTLSDKVKDSPEMSNLLMTDREMDYYERSVEWIEAKDWRFSVGQITGRVFTNITGLPRELRPFLRLDGEPLVEIDVSACQPLLLYQLYQKGEPEVTKYLDVVLSGQFYETLDKLLEKPYGKERRDELKRAIFTQVFFDEIWPVKSPLCQAFYDQFPVLYSEIVKFKTPNYKALSHRLQRDEAEIVINTVVGRLMENPIIPVVTVHDCILTTPAHAKEVESLLKEAFAEKVGVMPNVKHKNHSEHWAYKEELLAKRQSEPVKDYDYSAEEMAEMEECRREMEEEDMEKEEAETEWAIP